MNAQELYRAGQLTEAIAHLNDEVRAKPTDIERRSFLAELLCVAGNLERADTQLETIEKMQAKAGPSLGLIRQLIRAEKVRVEVERDGRVPEFLGAPPEHVQLLLRARIALRAGDEAESAQLCAAAESARPAVGGTCDGARFDDIRDLDDLTAGVIELLTSTGRHMWVPIERVVSIEFDAPAQPLDLIWRPAAMAVRDGPEGKVFVPAIYLHADGGDDAARLGRRTDWLASAGGDLVRGVGLRSYLVGEEERSILELSKLEFDAPVQGA